MSLPMPNIRHLESGDGSCSLTYEGLDEAPAQAAGGAMYLLRVSRPEGVTEIRATVQSTTFRRAEQQARAEGFDVENMTLTEMRKYREHFAEKYGRSSYVVLFLYADEKKGGPTRRIDNEAELSQIFCKMFLRMQASYRYNNSEYPKCGEGFYSDTIDYRPWGVDPELIRTFTAAEALGLR